VCKAIFKVVDELIEDALIKYITLTIAENLEGKYSMSAIEIFTQQYHAGVTTRVEALDAVRISISFYMG